MKKQYAVALFISMVSLATYANKLQASETILSQKDLQNISGTQHTNQVLKNIDKFLSRLIVIAGAVGITGKFIPTKTYEPTVIIPTGIEKKVIYGKEFPLPTFTTYNRKFYYNKKGITGFTEEGNFNLVQPTVLKTCAGIAGSALVGKMLVKILRARECNKNVVSFIIQDIFA